MVEDDFKILKINKSNRELVTKFLQLAGSSLDTFRYFDKRSLDVIDNHKLTLLGVSRSMPIAYGHLDYDDKGRLWLGIAISENHIGRGYGREIMNSLLSYAENNNLLEIYLSVDKLNEKAISMYKKNGFEVSGKHGDNVLIMKKCVENCLESVYISSMAFLGKPIEDIISVCKRNKLNLEFSSSLPFRSDMEAIYLGASLKKMIHNYFPAPKIPFVLNLASRNEDIRRVSIEHCKKCIKLSRKSNSPFYAVHAGFCIDPKPDELGKIISVNESFDKERNKELFIKSVKELLVVAEENDVDLLIENNVLAPFNYEAKGNFLLCTESSEIEWLFNSVKNSRLGLLLDTAHLKVSCKTLGLDLEEEFEKIKTYAKAFHHSDNDGTVDNNMPIGKDYWFLKYFNMFKKNIHVLEVKSIVPLKITEQLKLLLGNGY